MKVIFYKKIYKRYKRIDRDSILSYYHNSLVSRKNVQKNNNHRFQIRRRWRDIAKANLLRPRTNLRKLEKFRITEILKRGVLKRPRYFARIEFVKRASRCLVIWTKWRVYESIGKR